MEREGEAAQEEEDEDEEGEEECQESNCFSVAMVMVVVVMKDGEAMEQEYGVLNAVGEDRYLNGGMVAEEVRAEDSEADF